MAEARRRDAEETCVQRAEQAAQALRAAREDAAMPRPATHAILR